MQTHFRHCIAMLANRDYSNTKMAQMRTPLNLKKSTRQKGYNDNVDNEEGFFKMPR